MKLVQLPLELRGFYHVLFDWACVSTPPRKRGWLYQNGSPLDVKALSICCRVPEETCKNYLVTLVERGALSRNNAGAWGFPHFRNHQRHMTLLRRREGPKIVSLAPKLHHKSTTKAPLEAEAEAEADKEEGDTSVSLSAKADAQGVLTVPYDKIAEAWNEFAEPLGLPQVRIPLAKPYRAKVKLRWVEWARDGEPWQVWQEILAGIRNWPWALGKEADGKTPWLIDLEYVIRNGTNWEKLVQRAHVLPRGPYAAIDAYFAAKQEGHDEKRS